MMYYYLMAALPYLKFEEPLQITRHDFLNNCANWCTEAEFKIICKLADNTNVEGNTIINSWNMFNNNLKQELAKHRSKGQIDYLSEDVKNIIGTSNPLLKEKAYEKRRWDYLEELELNQAFSFNALIIYLEKLKILERLHTFQVDSGKKNFENLREVIYERNKG